MPDIELSTTYTSVQRHDILAKSLAYPVALAYWLFFFFFFYLKDTGKLRIGKLISYSISSLFLHCHIISLKAIQRYSEQRLIDTLKCIIV